MKHFLPVPVALRRACWSMQALLAIIVMYIAQAGMTENIAIKSVLSEGRRRPALVITRRRHRHAAMTSAHFRATPCWRKQRSGQAWGEHRVCAQINDNATGSMP